MLCSATVAKQFMRYIPCRFYNFITDVLYFLTMRTYPECLRYVVFEMPGLMLIRLLKFPRAGSLGKNHHRLPCIFVGIGKPGVKFAGIEVSTCSPQIFIRASYGSKIL